MKVIIPTMSMTMPKTHTPQNFLITIITLIMLTTIKSPTINSNTHTTMLTQDSLSTTMLLLSLISTLLIIMSTTTLLTVNKTIPLILLILTLTFLSSNMLLFYISFELTLIPTLILITSKGKQPERLQAGLYLLMYTTVASIPLLIMILSMESISFTYSTTMTQSTTMFWITITAFMVKMPMFLTHLWLPKAHVEAPMEGSMILATILLKMGGYGMIRFLPLLMKKMQHFNTILISISLVGATSTSIICIRQTDLKAMIAYSSVSHMALVISSLSTMNNKGLTGAILMMVGHGLSSSALFLMVTLIYSNSHTRNTLHFKGLITILPNITMWWLIFIASNMSAPPTINTLSEIMMLSSLMDWNFLTTFMFTITNLMTAVFSINLFINTTHNNPTMKNSSSTKTNQFYPLITHLTPTIMMTMKPEFMSNMLLFSLKQKQWFVESQNLIMKKMSSIMFSSSMITMTLSLLLMTKNTIIILEFNFMNHSMINMPISIISDWTSMMFLSTVTLISSFIINFSKFYIPKNELARFTLLLMIFVTSMIMLIMSNNLITIIIGWDGLGFSSYILVAYYQNWNSSSSSSMTIISNRIGDIAMIATMAILWNSTLNTPQNQNFPKTTLLLILTAAMTKSAQFPFSAWLPAAMAAPTPISALVHSSTLVTAGIYLMIRSSTSTHPYCFSMMITTASFTTLMAGACANWEQDMKKIIALSTLSQIAMMMFSISIQAYKLAFIHLIIHAIFKSTIFLCAGTLISMSSYQDTRSLNLSNSLPSILSTLGISNMALMGMPFMAGFYSKDMIMESMMSFNPTFSIITMLMSIGLTCSYSIRMTLMITKPTMKIKPDSTSNQSSHATNPLMMMAPLSILAGATIIWTSFPEITFILPQSQKTMTPLMITMGLMMGLTLSFNKKLYIKMNEMSINLWFNHTTSSYNLILYNPTMKNFQKNDKMWLETMGPQGTWTLIKNSSKTLTNHPTTLLSSTLLTTLTMLMLY